MSGRTYVVLVVGLLAALVALEAFRPRPLDLRVRLEREGDAPFDAEVFFEALPGWLGQPVEVADQPPFVVLADSGLGARTYLFLTPSFAPDPAEAERLLAFVERGGAVAVFTSALSGPFAEALGDTTDGGFGLTVDPVFGGFDAFGNSGSLEGDTLAVEAPGAAGEYAFPVLVREAEIAGLDARAEVLGTAVWPYGGDDRMVTLARVRHGRGSVLVASTPVAFSNAALTGDGDGAAYAAAVVAALPDRPVLWDDHAKPFRENAETPLRFVLRTPALRFAYGLLLVAGVLYVAFRGRRWQRPVPVVTPPPNAQREFARTVGRLHYVHRDDAALASRLERHVLDRLRTELRVPEPDLSPETARLAAARAGAPEADALALFAALRRARQRPDPDGLVRLDRQIARFFRHAHV